MSTSFENAEPTCNTTRREAPIWVVSTKCFNELMHYPSYGHAARVQALTSSKHLPRNEKHTNRATFVPCGRGCVVTALAIESKFQMVENNFSCGQMSTGSFYKIARCAQMVEQHARQHAVHYTSLLLTRPDLRLLGPWSDSNERADERKIDSPAGQASSCAPLAI